MERSGSASTWLVLFVGVLAATLIPSCAAAEIKIRPTEWSLHLLPSGITGAESLAFDRHGHGPYTGVSDGRVLRWGGDAVGWKTFTNHADYRRLPMCTMHVAPSEETERMCGRSLGLAFHQKTGYLYIANAYKGLTRVGPNGGEAEVLTTGADGVPFNFVNGIDVDQTIGDVYFTDSSTTYPRRFNTEIMMNADTTGRLLKFNPRTKHVTMLKDGLPCQVFKYHLKGPKTGQYELFADLPGYPDNVRRDEKDGYWVALNQEKGRPNMTAPVKHLVGVRLNSDGMEVEELTAAKGVTLSEVTERSGKLWLGSVELDYIGPVA